MLLITGADGQLGNELRRLIDSDKALFIDRKELDITDEVAVRDFFLANEIDLVINCAAYTAVDKAEDNAAAADAVNRVGAELLAKYGKKVIHVSTDYVFDGTAHAPYREDDAANPVSVYGSTKLAGEKAVLAAAQTAVIIRTAWLYSSFGNNFVKTMRRLGSSRPRLGVVFDQVGSPTYAADLAAAIVRMVPLVRDGQKDVYHFTNEGVASWYDFAHAIMVLSGLQCAVSPIRSEDYPTRAARPAYSVLDKAKIKNDFGLEIPHWTDALRRCIRELEQKEGCK